MLRGSKQERSDDVVDVLGRGGKGVDACRASVSLDVEKVARDRSEEAFEQAAAGNLASRDEAGGTAMGTGLDRPRLLTIHAGSAPL